MSGAARRSENQDHSKNLTEGQHRRIRDAERKLHEGLDAHEKMRDLFDPASRPVDLRSHSSNMADEVRKLDRDLQEYAVTILRVLSEGDLSVDSAALFERGIKGNVREIIERAFNEVNNADLPFLDQDTLDDVINGR